MIDIKKVKEDAQKEFLEEQATQAKVRLKSKMKELENARNLVRNIERELEDLEASLVE